VTHIHQVPLSLLLELRERMLTPEHPGRPVVWPYDDTAVHYGLYDAGLLIGCVSLTEQAPDYRAASRAYHLHSMAVESSYRGRGFGRLLLEHVFSTLGDEKADLVWATARPSALEFYKAHGFLDLGQVRIKPTDALMHYIERPL
jgi:ribosomal protein S18 acetylase RimI-like enzyme